MIFALSSVKVAFRSFSISRTKTTEAALTDTKRVPFANASAEGDAGDGGDARAAWAAWRSSRGDPAACGGESLLGVQNRSKGPV